MGNGINLSSIIFFTVFIIAVSFVLKFLKTDLPFTETGRIQKVYHLQSDKIFHLRPFFYPWMNMIGINVPVLLEAAAALLVGVRLQNIFIDFVSRIVLLLDSTLKMGDIIEVKTGL